MNPRVTIITLNWNGWQDTIECLESLYDIDYDNYHIVLVDNASTDESLAEIDAYCRNKRTLTSRITQHLIRNKPTMVVHYGAHDNMQKAAAARWHECDPIMRSL